MKKMINMMVMIASAGLLYGCGGGSMLGSSDAEDHKLIPDVVDEDPNPQRPTAGLAVLRAANQHILYQGNPSSFHGVNLQYGDDPLGRIEGIQAIRDTGSNIVRITVYSDTNVQNLEAALGVATANNLFVILSLADADLACSDDDALFSKAVQTTWLKTFLPVIHQDRYQGNLMINIARGWGPKDIFSGYSTGYKTYIDNYKTAIRAFRRAGFQVPLVIDAPCGTDYYAFDAYRGRELLAADVEKNLVLSVHGYGAYWNSNARIEQALTVLRSQNMPIIMSEFGGSGVGERPVNHKQILEKGAGDFAVSVSIPWQSDNDKVAYIVPLDAPIDVTGTDISVDIKFDDAYINDGALGFQLYLRDENDLYANLSWNGAGQQEPKVWNTITAAITNSGSFNWAEPGFDMTRVAKLGLELVANGKAANIGGHIQFDNFKVVEGSGAKELLRVNFENAITGWESGWNGTALALVNGEGVGLTRADETFELTAIYRGITGVDFTKPIQIKATIFFPASYEGSWIYGKFFNNEGDWVQSSDIGSITYGAWNDVVLTADFGEQGAGLSSLGIQVGNLGAAGDPLVALDPTNYEPIIIKDLVISGVEANNAFELGVIYHSTFEASEDNWVAYSWGDAANVVAADGALHITAKEVAGRIDVQHQNPARIEGLNFNDPFTLKTRIFIPAYYEGATTLTAQFYLQDVNWSNHFDVFNYAYEDLVIGDWNDIEIQVEFPEAFQRDGVPRHMGFSFATNLGGADGIPMSATDPIRIDEIIFEGMVPVEKEEVIIGQMDFFYQHHFTGLVVDFTEGAIQVEDLATSITPLVRSEGFSWLAWSWFGNAADSVDLDLTTVVGDATALTPRGEDIVHGKGGLRYYAPLAPAPDDLTDE